MRARALLDALGAAKDRHRAAARPPAGDRSGETCSNASWTPIATCSTPATAAEGRTGPGGSSRRRSSSRSRRFAARSEPRAPTPRPTGPRVSRAWPKSRPSSARTRPCCRSRSGSTEDILGQNAGGAWLLVSTRAGTVAHRIPDRVRLQAVVPVFLGLFARRDGREAVPGADALSRAPGPRPAGPARRGGSIGHRPRRSPAPLAFRGSTARGRSRTPGRPLRNRPGPFGHPVAALARVAAGDCSARRPRDGRSRRSTAGTDRPLRSAATREWSLAFGRTPGAATSRAGRGPRGRAAPGRQHALGGRRRLRRGAQEGSAGGLRPSPFRRPRRGGRGTARALGGVARARRRGGGWLAAEPRDRRSAARRPGGGAVGLPVGGRIRAPGRGRAEPGPRVLPGRVAGRSGRPLAAARRRDRDVSSIPSTATSPAA